MEWIETTAATVEEARELALDQLGVDESDAEFEILEEPKSGLFGRTKGIARVRVRVIPKAPRPKADRKRRSKKRSEESGYNTGTTAKRTEAKSDSGSPKNGRKPSEKAVAAKTQTDTDKSDGGQQGSSRPERERGRSNERNKPPMDEAEQISTVEDFLKDLAASFGLDVTVESSFDDGDLRANVVGEDLGILVGPRLATLDAIQEITRTTLQRQAAGREYARVSVDVAGIRSRRSEALSEFVENAAEQVRNDNVTVIFEVMTSADRKQVHDKASSLEGIRSGSEGEDPRRRVALKPE